MPADYLVRLPLNEQILSIRRGSRRRRIADLRRPIGCGKLGEDHRHDGAFKKSFNFLLWRIRQKSYAPPLRLLQAPRKRARSMNGIGVGEQKPLASSVRSPGNERVIFS